MVPVFTNTSLMGPLPLAVKPVARPVLHDAVQVKVAPVVAEVGVNERVLPVQIF